MGGLFQKPQALNRYLRKLQRIADEHGVAVVITNQAPAEGRRWVLARWKKGLVVKDQDGVLTSIVFMNKNRIRFFWGDRMGWFTKCDMKPISSWWKKWWISRETKQQRGYFMGRNQQGGSEKRAKPSQNTSCR